MLYIHVLCIYDDCSKSSFKKYFVVPSYCSQNCKVVTHFVRYIYLYVVCCGCRVRLKKWLYDFLCFLWVPPTTVHISHPCSYVTSFSYNLSVFYFSVPKYNQKHTIYILSQSPNQMCLVPYQTLSNIQIIINIMSQVCNPHQYTLSSTLS